MSRAAPKIKPTFLQLEPPRKFNFSDTAYFFTISLQLVLKCGLIAKKYAERCGIKHNLNALYTFKAFQHAEKAICESNCKKSMLKVVGL